uniref:MP n=1 Tax=Daiswa trichovirus 1 TaxID=2794435 RepID=A0A7T5UG56_9VIRU|nr:MP [Daiswa trichovirus 1]
MEIIPVNKFVKEFENTGSLTDSIPSDSIYRDIPWLGSKVRGRISKREVNVSVTPQPGGVCISGFPLFDTEDIKFYDAQHKLGNTYLDLGCVVIAIRGLFKKGAGVTGKLILFDNMFDNMSQAKIASFKFNLDGGFAAFAVFPGYSIASNDNLNERLQAIVSFDNLNVRDAKFQPIAISVGCVCRISPTAFPPRTPELSGSSELFQNIQNSEYLSMEGIEESTSELKRAFSTQIVKPSFATEGTKRRQRKSFLRRLPPTKITDISVDYLAEPGSSMGRSESTRVVGSIIDRSGKGISMGRMSSSDSDTLALPKMSSFDPRA